MWHNTVGCIRSIFH